MQHIDTTADIEKLQAAMRKEVCDNTALIQVLTDPKYQDPRALHQLKTDYERKTNNILAEQIASKTDGDFKVALLALLWGPLDYDVYTLQRALFSEGIEALNDVLLCRSNADIGAILNKYESTYTDSDLVQLIASKVDDSLFHLYNLILSGNRAENEAPAIYAEIEKEAARIYRLINGSSDDPTTPIVNMLASANIGQLRAMSIIYGRNYGKLDEGISGKFSGCMKETLLRILHFAVDSGDSDLTGLCNALTSQRRDIFIYRALRLYWSGARRLQELHTPSMRNRRPMETQLIYRLPNGDFRELMIALIGEKSTST
ncbi:hypothetical protein A0O28_0089530 [Trichoderma guizhouense]|uniref:Annexin n=1 Tax=Trichoderma guizhouense TaxID=1491466 RepID=A0A1T3CUY7_9HYPO|nr:hypothetical protein A0O28_0089530 [Trichoderma guizhouense]